MTKLLNKPLKIFSLYALVVLILSIPVYYFVIDYIWLSELDERNTVIKNHLQDKLSKIQKSDAEVEQLVNVWNVLIPNVSLKKDSILTDDKFYSVSREIIENGNKEMERYRGLSSVLFVNDVAHRLEIETNVEEADETLMAITIVTFLFFCFLLLGFVLLNKRISDKIWMPFRSTLEKLKLFDLNIQQKIKFEHSDIEEFEELNEELDKMIQKNVSTFNQQKQFIENASHELQTPLAVLKSKIDILIQDESLTKEQAKLISSIELPLSRVSRINKNLLLLAKIENKQFIENDILDIVDCVNKSFDLLTYYINGKHFDINKNFTASFSVTCNKFLLETLINNLLINAIKHTSKNGSITVNLTENKLEILNTGSAELDSTTLFQRFMTGSSESSGNGLGLSIIKEICYRYGWEISYCFQKNNHIFSLKF